MSGKRVIGASQVTEGWFVFKDEHRAVYRLDGDFRGIEAGDILYNGAEELLSEGIKFFEIDFTQARYLSSLGIALLIRLKKRLLEKGAQLKLTQVNKDIVRVMTITRTDSFLLPEEG